MSVTQSKMSSGDRRLKQAVEYVSRQWFPVNRAVVSDIQTKLNSGAYDGNGAQLVQDLKADFAYFTYCLHKMKSEEINDGANPLEGLYQSEDQRLKDILMSSANEISKHDISSAEHGQAQRFKFTVLSCSAADLFANSQKSDNDMAFTCTLLRQLGLNLVAWNYPTIYTRALSLVRAANASIDEILEENLGFSPSLLANELIFTERTCPLIKKASGIVGSNGASSQSDNQTQTDQATIGICEISEAFAQLNDPEHYPQISRNFETVIMQVDQYLGEGGMSTIMNSVNAKYARYVSAMPEVFKVDSSLEQHMEKVASDYTNKIFEKNTYAQRCSDKIKRELKEVYRHVSRGQLSSMGVGHLVNRVIPLAGFTQGCVYLLDSKKMMLVPKLRIGASSLERYKAINCSLVSPEGSLIVEALYCSMPIKQEGVFLHNDLVSPILGPLGSKEPMGVLYIEMGPVLLAQQMEEPLVLFKAIRNAFNDCLNV